MVAPRWPWRISRVSAAEKEVKFFLGRVYVDDAAWQNPAEPQAREVSEVFFRRFYKPRCFLNIGNVEGASSRATGEQMHHVVGAAGVAALARARLLQACFCPPVVRPSGCGKKGLQQSGSAKFLIPPQGGS